MTLPQNVKDAVDRIWRNRAQTMDTQIVKEELHRLAEADSRLAAANALLRECEDLAADPELKGDLFYRIQSHLQGDGDEALPADRRTPEQPE